MARSNTKPTSSDNTTTLQVGSAIQPDADFDLTANGAPDPFADLSRLRLAQDFTAGAVEKVLVRIPVGRPPASEFIRTHPDTAFYLDAALIRVAGEEPHLVLPAVQPSIPDMWEGFRLVTYITRGGVLGIWPLRLAREGGRRNAWTDSAHECAELAKTRWIRVKSDMEAGFYQPLAALGELPDPVWPDKTFVEILKIAFGSRIVSDTEHPLVQRLLGRE